MQVTLTTTVALPAPPSDTKKDYSCLAPCRYAKVGDPFFSCWFRRATAIRNNDSSFRGPIDATLEGMIEAFELRKQC